MSYALFGRSEAYRSKPDDHQSANFSDRNNENDFFADFD